MIVFEKGIFTETELIEATKDIIGMRCRTNKNGDFEVYSNIWTMTADIFRNIKRKIRIG